MHRYQLLFILTFLYQLGFSQSEKWIHGKINVRDATPQGVHVINLVNEKETISDAKGEFNIQAKTDDLLVFSSSHLDYQRKIIEKEDYENGAIIMEMTSKVTQLDEVKIITYPEFDPVKLRLIPAPAKKVSRSQRDIRTANHTPLKKFTNLWDGRLTMQKKLEAETEREIIRLNRLDELFDNNYYTEELNLKPEQIYNFKNYVINDPNMTNMLHSHNKALIAFALLQSAMKYKLLQESGEK